METDGICRMSYQPDELQKAFLRWIRLKTVAKTHPAFQKNASSPVGIPLKRATQESSNKPSPSGLESGRDGPQRLK